MKDITYNKKILDMIKELSGSVIKGFIIKKVDDIVSIKVKESSLSINSEFITNTSNLDFEGEEIAFAEGVYEEFYKFFGQFKNPSLKQDGYKLIMKENNQTIKFSPSNPKVIDVSKQFKGVKELPKPAVSFKLDSEQFSSIKKMIKMLNSEKVQFIAKGTNLDILIENSISKNGSTISLELESEVNEEVDISINPIVFQVAPSLAYTVGIIPQAKMFHFSSINEDFTLNLYNGLKAIGEVSNV